MINRNKERQITRGNGKGSARDGGRMQDGSAGETKVARAAVKLEEQQQRQEVISRVPQGNGRRSGGGSSRSATDREENNAAAAALAKGLRGRMKQYKQRVAVNESGGADTRRSTYNRKGIEDDYALQENYGRKAGYDRSDRIGGRGNLQVGAKRRSIAMPASEHGQDHVGPKDWDGPSNDGYLGNRQWLDGISIVRGCLPEPYGAKWERQRDEEREKWYMRECVKQHDDPQRSPRGASLGRYGEQGRWGEPVDAWDGFERDGRDGAKGDARSQQDSVRGKGRRTVLERYWDRPELMRPLQYESRSEGHRDNRLGRGGRGEGTIGRVDQCTKAGGGSGRFMRPMEQVAPQQTEVWARGGRQYISSAATRAAATDQYESQREDGRRQGSRRSGGGGYGAERGGGSWHEDNRAQEEKLSIGVMLKYPTLESRRRGGAEPYWRDESVQMERKRGYGESLEQDGYWDRCMRLEQTYHDEAWRNCEATTAVWCYIRADGAMPPFKTPQDVLSLTCHRHFNEHGGAGAAEVAKMQGFSLENHGYLDDMGSSAEGTTIAESLHALVDRIMYLATYCTARGSRVLEEERADRLWEWRQSWSEVTGKISRFFAANKKHLPAGGQREQNFKQAIEQDLVDVQVAIRHASDAMKVSCNICPAGWQAGRLPRPQFRRTMTMIELAASMFFLVPEDKGVGIRAVGGGEATSKGINKRERRGMVSEGMGATRNGAMTGGVKECNEYRRSGVCTYENKTGMKCRFVPCTSERAARSGGQARGGGICGNGGSGEGSSSIDGEHRIGSGRGIRAGSEQGSAKRQRVV